MTGVPATPWQPMGRDECLDLLKTATCGRLALTANAMPSVVPVAIEMSDGDVVLRSLVGPQVTVHHHQVVALEAGCLDDLADRRWSVVVLGMLVVDQTDAEPDGAGAPFRFRLSTEFTSGWCSGSPSDLGESARSDEKGNADRDLLRTR
ncbi:MAG: pyridoxamine 5'-phosphate oxidase family protein [Acidimicrobiales bacterium]